MNRRIPGGFKTPITKRLLRAGQNEERRRLSRDQAFSRHRDLSNSPDKAQKTKTTGSIDSRLRKWKLEKELKKKLEQRNKKPVFKVSVVHHHFYSPPVSDRIKPKPAPCHTRGAHRIKNQATPPKRITRATQKRLEAKKAQAALASTSEASSSTTERKSMSKLLKSSKKAAKISLAPQNYAFKVPTGVKEIPMFGRHAITDSPQAKKDLAEEVRIQIKEPWPTSGIMETRNSSKKIRKSLIRSNAIENVSSDSSEENSSPSVEKENESEENTDDAAVEKNEFTDTPPRSGSPAPAIFSPYITTSRGKDSARRERRSKMGMGRTPPDKIPTKETVMQNLNISIEEEERTAQYFKFILEREIDRLNEICVKWEAMKNEPEITEDACYLINQAVGQTRLLVKKKFERFRGLVLDCETGKGEMLVQCRDLQGFWDMMYMEVKDCEARFEKLDKLRSNNWIEDEIIVQTKKAIVKKKAGSGLKMMGKSSARSWILAKKKEMLKAEMIAEEILILDKNEKELKSSDAGNGHVTLNEEPSTSGSARTSPRLIPETGKRANLKQTPKKTPVSLLKKVQVSAARRSLRSPLTIMKVSKMCKTPEVRLDETISYVNSDQTPAKSILKKSNENLNHDSSITKSSRKVDFRDDVLPKETEVDENLENSIDLGRALARIDTYFSDDSDEFHEPVNDETKYVTMRRVEKRLDFGDTTFDSTENVDTAESSEFIAATPDNSSLPVINITGPTPAKKLSNRKSSLNTKKRRSVISESSNENPSPEIDNSSTRVLRNRTVCVNTPNKHNRRSTKSMTKEKSADLNSSTKENNDPQIEEPKINEIELNDFVVNRNESQNQNNKFGKRRRSMRKSMRLNDDDCSACAIFTKTPQSTGPKTRRSRKVSLLGENQSVSFIPLSNGDLISFDSPSTKSAMRRRRHSHDFMQTLQNA